MISVGYIKRKIKWQLLVFYQNICKTTSKLTEQAIFFLFEWQIEILRAEYL